MDRLLERPRLERMRTRLNVYRRIANEPDGVLLLGYVFTLLLVASSADRDIATCSWIQR